MATILDPFEARRKRTIKTVVYSVIGLILFVLIVSNWPFVQVSEGERGIILKFGQAQEQVLGTGLKIVNPFSTDIEKMDVRVQKEEVTASAASKDLQTVSSKVAVTYHLDETKVLQVYKAVRQDYSNRYIAPNIQEAVKAATAKYTAEELITKREAVRDEIKTNFVDKLAGTGLIVDGISIVDFDFSGQFNAAIEAKVTAEQKAKEAENKLKQVEAEAKQSVAKAQAEAEAIRLQGDAANSQNYIRLKELEVQLEFAKHWTGNYPQYYITGGNNAPVQFLPIPTGK